MMNPLDRLRGITRRGLLRSSGMLAAAGLLPEAVQHAAAAPSHELHIGSNIYESIGVRPLINCKGTYTIISGSQSLPEVKQAMLEASKHYVQMDELMDAVGARLAELTKADWGIVTGGCAAAATHATAACIAGTDPEKMQQLPKLQGLKNEVIMPRYSRNVYDHAVRMLGVDIIEVNTAEELERAFNPRTAMILVLSCPDAEKGPLSIPNVAMAAKKHDVPMLVDAAAEVLTIPNIHLGHGATMVAYSGGKCIRGPQTAGLLLGRKDLVRAAWFNAGPHHAFGRSLKVGKEEIMGMLAAVETWTRRDQTAEFKMWEGWLGYISDRVTKVPGVTTQVIQPEDLSNHSPELKIMWDQAALGLSGRDVEKILLDGSPRIILGGSGGNSVTVMPYMMMPEDHKIAANALHAVLANPPKIEKPPKPTGETVNVRGQWAVHIEYLLGSANHIVMLEQSGDKLTGTHASETLKGDLRGNVQANQVHFRSVHPIQGTAVMYAFAGTATSESMQGTVNLGEYGEAKWTARPTGH